ncbi:MAG: lytic murein transglycosylase [Mesorhizobium sp.]|nr:MAG: lytic murein transglycosylase [Mesorhizobium sp.]TIN76054.1 MAG: lytic murein transglycosylase [Mesorhizobium sp.]
MRAVAILRAPLCPAEHLPHLGGDWLSSRLSLISSVAGPSGAPKLPISPLEGEIAGRPEGGAVPPARPTRVP